MTDAVWPASLPQDVERPYQETLADNTVTTPMEIGPAKKRRRSTAGVSTLSATVQLTTAQTETLQTFFEDTLAGGALRFDWTHPRTQVAAVFRFAKPPQISHVSGPNWQARLELEVLPS